MGCIWMALGVLALVLVALYLGIGGVAAAQLTLPKRVFDETLNPGAHGLSFEELTIPARGDGLRIAAWYIPSEENHRAIILVHGRDNSRTNGFVDHFVEFAGELHRAGFSVLMIDLRGHGQSADSRYTFGLNERRDVLGAVDWLRAHGYGTGSVGVLGYSLGAASVVGAASEEPDLAAIWIDSSYAEVASVIEGSWKQESGLPLVFLHSTRFMGRLLYGIDITASRPVDEIGRIAPRPIFLTHCRQDPMIPIAHMERLLGKSGRSQSWIISNCDQHTLQDTIVPEKYNHHALGYNLQPEMYTQRVIQFFDESLR
jgi:pimeloyl-ACP methyl ester carboxylesterase